MLIKITEMNYYYYYYYYGFDIALSEVYTIHQGSKAETIYSALQD